jgi:hypothetical protein
MPLTSDIAGGPFAFLRQLISPPLRPGPLFPANPMVLESPHKGGAGERSSRNQIRLLLADDAVVVRKAIRRVLQEASHR